MRSVSTRLGSATVGILLTACGGAGVDDAVAGSAHATDAQMLELTGTDVLAFTPHRVTVAAGEVVVELTSQPAAPHTFTIEELDDREVVRADGGQTARGTVELEPGTYTFYCSIPGHRQAGMEGTLTAQ